MKLLCYDEPRHHRRLMNRFLRGCAAFAFIFVVFVPVHAQTAPPQTLSEDQTRQREAEVLNALDLTRPELAQVAAAWQANDAAGAEKALAAYLRSRESVHWNPAAATEPLTDRDKTLADWAVEGKLEGGQTPYFYTFPNGDIDWHYNATEHMQGIASDNEWQWQLSRMAVWGPLGRAYRTSRDERYAQTFD